MIHQHRPVEIEVEVEDGKEEEDMAVVSRRVVCTDRKRRHIVSSSKPEPFVGSGGTRPTWKVIHYLADAFYGT